MGRSPEIKSLGPEIKSLGPVLNWDMPIYTCDHGPGSLTSWYHLDWHEHIKEYNKCPVRFLCCICSLYPQASSLSPCPTVMTSLTEKDCETSKENFWIQSSKRKKSWLISFWKSERSTVSEGATDYITESHIQSSPIGSSIAAQFESSAVCSHATVSFLSYTCLRTEQKQKMKQHVEKEALHSNCKAPHNLRSAWECIPSRMNCWHKAG